MSSQEDIVGTTKATQETTEADASSRSFVNERVNAKARAYYAANRDKVRARQAVYHAANREKLKARMAARRVAKRDQVLAYAAAYRAANREKRAAYKAANPEKVRAWRQIHSHRRRARLLGNLVIPFTHEQLEQRRSMFPKCWICREAEPTQDDHVKPIAKGGGHLLANLRPACATCNRKKSAQWPFVPELAGA